MKSISFLKNIKNAEWVCIIFLIFTAINILSNPFALNWSDVKWSHFPRIDLLAIILSIWIFKISNNQKKIRLKALTTLAVGILVLEATFQSYFILVWFIIINLFYFLKDKTLLIKNLDSLRLIAPFFVMLYLYPFLPLLYHSKESAGISDLDGLLLRADIILFQGVNPHSFLEEHINNYILEVAAFCYTFYGFLIALTLAGIYLIKSEKECEEFIFMLSLTFMIGFIGYVIVPAIGPIYTMEFKNPLKLVFMHDFKYQLMDKARIPRDCFPSLHTAITLILCYHIKRHAPIWSKWMLLPFSILIPASCILLRYHYVVDVIAGIVLAIAVIMAGKKTYSEPTKKLNY